MKNQALPKSNFCIKISKVPNSQETLEAHSTFPDNLRCARDACQTQIPVCTF